LNFSKSVLFFSILPSGASNRVKGAEKWPFLDVLSKGFFCKKARNAIFGIEEPQGVPNIELVVFF
jgi:hypothetical protein